jgi:hypothetical protein
MNTPHANQNANHHTTSQLIDRALHQLGHVQPQPGMKNRILRSLRPSPTALKPAFAWPRLAFASLAGVCLCAAVVVGSLQHSHAVAAQNHPALPILQQQSGVATASSTRISAHPAIAPKGGGRSNQHLGTGRATVKPGTHIHGGDGIPVPPRIP